MNRPSECESALKYYLLEETGQVVKLMLEVESGN